MAQTEIDAIRALLSSKPRPIGWPERRKRLDDVGAAWPVAEDVELAAVDVNGVLGEYSIVPGRNAHTRGELSTRAGASVSSSLRRRADCLAILTKSGQRCCGDCHRWRQRRGRTHSRIDQPATRRATGASRMWVAYLAMDGFDDVGFDPREQG